MSVIGRFWFKDYLKNGAYLRHRSLGSPGLPPRSAYAMTILSNATTKAIDFAFSFLGKNSLAPKRRTLTYTQQANNMPTIPSHDSKNRM
jgi:hypothetical protein